LSKITEGNLVIAHGRGVSFLQTLEKISQSEFADIKLKAVGCGERKIM
jgi:hypothetical protein